MMRWWKVSPWETLVSKCGVSYPMTVSNHGKKGRIFPTDPRIVADFVWDECMEINVPVLWIVLVWEECVGSHVKSSGWSFQIFFIFSPTWGNDPI